MVALTGILLAEANGNPVHLLIFSLVAQLGVAFALVFHLELI